MNSTNRNGESASHESEGVPYLATRVARLALELDYVMAQLASTPTTAADALILASPLLHLSLVCDTLADTIYRAERAPLPLEAAA